MQPVRRLIRRYELDGDAYLGDIDMPGVPVSVLLALFTPRKDDPLLYDCYPVDRNKALALMPYLTEPLQLDRYAYYLEAEQVE